MRAGAEAEASATSVWSVPRYLAFFSNACAFCGEVYLHLGNAEVSHLTPEATLAAMTKPNDDFACFDDKDID